MNFYTCKHPEAADQCENHPLAGGLCKIPGNPRPTAKVIAVNVATGAHCGLPAPQQHDEHPDPQDRDKKTGPAVAVRVPSPKPAASVKQATSSTQEGRVDGCPSVNVRKKTRQALRRTTEAGG